MKKKKVLIIIDFFLVLFFVLLMIRIPYVVHYNKGNNLYNNGDYVGAIREYEKALECFPPKYKECSIRINLALSMLKRIENDDSKENKLKILKEAREIICEDGCANKEDDNGHSKEAERLKKDIEREIDKLQDEEDRDDKSTNEDEDEKDDEKQGNQDSSEKLKKLEEIQKQAMKGRDNELREANRFTEFEPYMGKTW